jgi:dienelactone hydrolase
MTNLRPFALVAVIACGTASSAPPVAEPTPTTATDVDAAAEATPDGGAEAGQRMDAAPDGSRLATCSPTEATCSGTLDPTELGVGITAVRSVTSNKDGRHYYCYPNDPRTVLGRFVLHIVGTGSDPQVDIAVSRRMCALGFVVLAPMYVNDKDARSVCGADAACFEGFRREIVQGGDSIPGVAVDVANSILNRVSTMAAKLSGTEPAYAQFTALRSAIASGDFSKIVLSGHSQGSGHALYLGREYAAERIVLLAGPSDRVPTPSNAVATWIAGFAVRSKTPSARLFGFVSEDDGIQGFDNIANTWDTLGMPAASCSHSSLGTGYSPACHRFVLPAAGCSSLDAHSVVVAENFDAACRSGRPPNRNTATWGALFGVP